MLAGFWFLKGTPQVRETPAGYHLKKTYGKTGRLIEILKKRYWIPSAFL